MNTHHKRCIWIARWSTGASGTVGTSWPNVTFSTGGAVCAYIPLRSNGTIDAVLALCAILA